MIKVLTIILFTICFSIVSCTNENRADLISTDLEINLPRFKIAIDTIDVPERINGINFYKDMILLKGENVTWLMNYDFSIDSIKTSRYNQKKFEYIVNYRDTLFAALIKRNKAYYYFLDVEYNWQSRKIIDLNVQKLIWKEPYFLSDSIYDIYSCCNGEFGGMLYFKNKITGRTTATIITCVNAVVRHNNAYYVSEYLAHMASSSTLYRICDPESLLEVSSDTLICSYYFEIPVASNSWDSLFYAYAQGVDVIYNAEYDSMLISSFFYKDYLLGLVHCAEKMKTYLTYIEEDKLITYDSITNSPFTRDNIRMHQMGDELWFDNSSYGTKCIGKISNDTLYFYYLR